VQNARWALWEQNQNENIPFGNFSVVFVNIYQTTGKMSKKHYFMLSGEFVERLVGFLNVTFLEVGRNSRFFCRGEKIV